MAGHISRLSESFEEPILVNADGRHDGWTPHSELESLRRVFSVSCSAETPAAIVEAREGDRIAVAKETVPSLTHDT